MEAQVCRRVGWDTDTLPRAVQLDKERGKLLPGEEEEAAKRNRDANDSVFPNDPLNCSGLRLLMSKKLAGGFHWG